MKNLVKIFGFFWLIHCIDVSVASDSNPDIDHPRKIHLVAYKTYVEHTIESLITEITLQYSLKNLSNGEEDKTQDNESIYIPIQNIYKIILLMLKKNTVFERERSSNKDDTCVTSNYLNFAKMQNIVLNLAIINRTIIKVALNDSFAFLNFFVQNKSPETTHKVYNLLTEYTQSSYITDSSLSFSPALQALNQFYIKTIQENQHNFLEDLPNELLQMIFNHVDLEQTNLPQINRNFFQKVTGYSVTDLDKKGIDHLPTLPYLDDKVSCFKLNQPALPYLDDKVSCLKLNQKSKMIFKNMSFSMAFEVSLLKYIRSDSFERDKLLSIIECDRYCDISSYLIYTFPECVLYKIYNLKSSQ